MLDDPIVPAELYTAAYIYIREPVVDVSDFFFQDYSLPFLSSIGVQLRRIQDTLIRVDYRGRKGGGRATRHSRAFPTLDPSIGEKFFSRKKMQHESFLSPLLRDASPLVVVVDVLLTRLNERTRDEEG